MNMKTLDHRYALKWIGGNCERTANSGIFRLFCKFLLLAI